MRLPDLLARQARYAPEAVALVDGDRTIGYAALDTLVDRFAHVFHAAGVTAGERVVLALENGIDQVAAYLGVMRAGGIAVPLPAGPRSDRLAPAVRDCTPRVCVLDPATWRGLPATSPVHTVPAAFSLGAWPVRATRPAHVHPIEAALASATAVETGGVDTDLAAIIYTSGSTGEPRGVMLSHRNFVANADAIVSYLSLTAADRAMCVLPFYYVYGLSVLHSHLAVGASVVIDNRFAFPNLVLDAMQTHAVTGFAGVPSTFALLLHRSNLETTALPALRYVTQAGGNMPPQKVQEWLARGPRAAFFVMYGATEAAARLTYVPPDRLADKLGSIGIAIPSVTITVVGEDGAPAPVGHVGELVASGPNIAHGYWNNPAETEERFGPLGYRTGDLGYADADGFLFLVGRRHDMIKVGAHRVGAKEIEDVLHEHPEVADAAVVSAPHELHGEVPVAFVTLRHEIADAERVLQAHCAGRLAPHKVPVRIAIEANLPTLAGTGKIDKRTLRERAVSLATPSTPDR